MIQESIREKMKYFIREAYKTPAQKRVLYTFDNISTGVSAIDKNPLRDWTPEISQMVNGDSTCIFPLSLGCSSVYTNDGTEWAAPLFTEDQLLMLETLPFEIPSNHLGKAEQIISTMKGMLSSVKEGELIRCPDIQSPLGIAEIMCGSPLYVALLINSPAIHNLLKKITDYVIGFIQDVKKITGEKLNAARFPQVWNDQTGTYCSDDTISLLSPELHKEFSIPYINRISQACGPLFYHSCTFNEKYFQNILEVQNVRAYNWNITNSSDPKTIIDTFSGHAVLAPHIAADMHMDPNVRALGPFHDESGIIEYFLKNQRSDTTFYFQIMKMKPESMEKIYHIFKNYGCTPEQII